MRDPHDRSILARLLILLTALSLVAAACGGDDDDEGAGGGTDDSTADTVDPAELEEGGSVTFANDQEPLGWNINTSSDNLLALGIMTQLVYAQSFKVDPSFEVTLNEDMLESAEQTSDDPQTIEYVIKEEAVWSDDTPISADDYIFHWENLNGSDPEIDAVSTTGYDQITSVTGSEDGKTVTMVYETPYADWKGLFSDMLPAHIIPTLDGGWNTGLSGANIPTFSAGPFLFENYVPETSVTMVRNDAYYGEVSKLDEIVVRFGILAPDVPAALENEEIDLAYPQPQIDLVQQIEALAPEIESETSFGLSFEHMDFNLDHPLLARLEVRQAIAHAIDRNDLVARTVAQFSDEAQRLDNRIWLTGQPQYEPHGEEYAEQDLAAATELLEGIGAAKGGDGVYELDGERFSFRISTTGGNALREDTQVVLQDQLKEAGIELTIDNLEGGAVFDKFFPEADTLEARDFDIALFAWVGTPFPSSSKSLYTPNVDNSVGQNAMHYDNGGATDELFDQASASTDEAEVADLLNQVDEILWEDMPSIPLYAKPTFLPYRTSIANVQDNASTAGPLWNSNTWAIQGA